MGAAATDPRQREDVLPPAATRSLKIWLWIVLLAVLAMIALGGATRLLGAGLSITEWRPITGILPPIHEEDWNAAFQSYQEIPQFKLINHRMSLAQFKVIFFWEYAHRLLGRVVGLLYLVPFLFFWQRKAFPTGRVRAFSVPLVLLGLQGFLGWYMVKSGLSQRTEVSQYRLAAHLSLALVLLGYLHWQIRALQIPGMLIRGWFSRRTSVASGLLFLVGLQVVVGAFVAGTRAGYGYPTFPKMTGHWLHPDAFRLTPTWLNFFENPAMLQWLHRSLGWLLLFTALGVLSWALRRLSGPIRRSYLNWVFLVALQFALGVAALLSGMNVALAILHQLNAALLWLATLVILAEAKAPSLSNQVLAGKKKAE